MTNLLVFLEFISKHVDKGLPVDAIYIFRFQEGI